MTVGLSSGNVIAPWLNFLRGANTTTAPVGLFAKLHIGDPGAAGVNNAAAGSTTRVAVAMAAPSGNAIAMTGTPPVWTNGGTSETLSHISLWDALTVGNFDWSAVLTTPQPWASGNTFTLTNLSVSVAPVAS